MNYITNSQTDIISDLNKNAINRYFTDTYVEGQRYVIPELGADKTQEPEPWLKWMKDTASSLEIPIDHRVEEIPGDLRITIRDNHDYLWKVFLQRSIEDMMNGKRSIRILDKVQRESEQKETDDLMSELREELVKILQNTIDKIGDGMDERIVKANNKNKGGPVLDLSISDLRFLFEKDPAKNDNSSWSFLESVANKCILLLFQESRVRFYKREDPSAELLPRPKITLLERDFYVGLSQYLYNEHEKAIKRFSGLMDAYLADNDIHEGEVIDLSRVDFLEGHANIGVMLKEGEEISFRTLKRATRVFSIFVLSCLSSKSLIIRKTGNYDDMQLHIDDDEEVDRKSRFMYPNMIQFSDTLLERIGKSKSEDFDHNDPHPIFRTLEKDRGRYMNCLPENHLKKTHRDSSHGNYQHDGGYLVSMPYSQLRRSVSGDRFKGSRRVSRCETSEKSLKALNILQATQWEINLDFMDSVFTFRDSEGVSLNENTIKKKSMLIHSIEPRDEFLRIFYNERLIDNDRAKEALLRLNYVRKIIDNLGNVFWHAWSLDWRGRLSPKAPMLSPQQSDIDRAMIRFKHWKIIGKDGWRWFKIFLFGFFEQKEDSRFSEIPVKSLSLEERVDWVDNHKDIIRGLVGNWYGNNSQNARLLELEDPVGAKSVTWQRIAAVIEYDRLLTKFEETGDWSKVTSGHPVHFDASSNGLQHLSLLLNNKDLAEKVNVIQNPSNKKMDIYEYVCESAKRFWDNNDSELKGFLSSLGADNATLDLVRDTVFTRKFAKPPTMTIFYGAKRLERTFMGKNGKGKPRFICAKGCSSTRCDHLYDKKSRYVCWHEESPLYEAFKDKELISKSGILHHELKGQDTEQTRQQIFAHHLKRDYLKAIADSTDGAMDTLVNTLGSASGGNGDLSWELNDGFKVNHVYNKKENFLLQASGLHLNKMMSDVGVQSNSYYHFLKFLETSEESKIKLDDKMIENAIRDFCDNDEFKEESMKQTLNDWKANLSMDQFPAEITDWDAICAYRPMRGTNNFLRAVFQHVHRNLSENHNDFEQRWLMNSSISIKCEFPEITEEKDIAKMQSALAANFIHSIDGAHMRAVIREFDRKLREKDEYTSFWAVHDSFGTHACDIEILIQTIKDEMMNIHSEGDLWYLLKQGEVPKDNGFRNQIESLELQISDHLVS